MINLLNNHTILGLDVDKTLIKGPRSSILFDWCKHNYRSKALHILSFRTGEYYNQIIPDLERFGYYKQWFKSITGMPYTLWYMHKVYSDMLPFIHDEETAKTMLRKHRVTLEDCKSLYDEANIWKGKICADLGATVLVDDARDKVIKGCEMFNIQFVDALQL